MPLGSLAGIEPYTVAGPLLVRDTLKPQNLVKWSNVDSGGSGGWNQTKDGLEANAAGAVTGGQLHNDALNLDDVLVSVEMNYVADNGNPTIGLIVLATGNGNGGYRAAVQTAGHATPNITAIESNDGNAFQTFAPLKFAWGLNEWHSLAMYFRALGGLTSGAMYASIMIDGVEYVKATVPITKRGTVNASPKIGIYAFQAQVRYRNFNIMRMNGRSF